MSFEYMLLQTWTIFSPSLKQIGTHRNFSAEEKYAGDIFVLYRYVSRMIVHTKCFDIYVRSTCAFSLRLKAEIHDFLKPCSDEF